MAVEWEENLFIRLHSFLKEKMFFIRVENSVDGEVKRRRGAEFPESAKSDQKTHGIGSETSQKNIMAVWIGR